MSDTRARTPKVVAGRGDLRSVALSPTDGFVLSLVDGASNESEIAEMTGLPTEQVQTSLAKLEALRVVTFSGSPTPAATRVQPGPIGPRPSPAPTPPGNGPATSDENVDLDPETRRQILETHGALDRLDHYALLGVDERADKKALKRAYLALARTFHPDRYFRKSLGSYKPRMEAIFGRLSVAFEVVSEPERRAEYDAYLAEQRRARGIEERLAGAAAEVKRAEESIEHEVRTQASPHGATSSVPPARSSISSVPATSSAPVSASVPTAPSPQVEVAARRDALARRLMGQRAASSSSSPPPSRGSLAPPPMSTTADAMESLRRRYEERVAHAKAAQARRYVDHADAALSQGDAIAAANALRVAAGLTPADAALVSKAQDAQAKADVVLGETYARQAAYEDKTGNWAEAAKSWTRVCKARPTDSDAHERAANALVQAGGNLHEAARLCERACVLEPANARYRVSLAHVYLAAGLTLGARRELETAAQLAPHDGRIAEMLKRIASKA